MSKSLHLGEAILAAATQKRDAAKARSRPVTDEKPRDVILRACAAIAEKLSDDGFSFIKSGPKLKRVDNERVFSIWFQLDRNNIAGARAAVWIHAGVQNVGEAAFIAGGQIGNLVADRTWMEWDFADKAVRDSEIDDAVATIRRIVLPFFVQFETRA